MAGSLASLKNLPCPLGDSCKAFHCLFKHDDESGSAKTTSSSSEGARCDDESVDGPRKRPRLVSKDASFTPRTGPSDKGAPKQQAPTEKPREENKPWAGTNDQLTKSSPSQSVTQKTSFATPSNSPIPTMLGTKSSTRPTAATSASPSTPAGSAQRPSRKHQSTQPEALNPRLLKKSPAQHEMRLKLLKALHTQYTRLNKELEKTADAETKKLVLSAQELVSRALDEEENVAVKKPAIYANALKGRIMTYTRMSVEAWKKERIDEMKDPSSQDNDGPKPIVTGLTVSQEVKVLSTLAIDLGGLERFGYVAHIPSSEDIESARNAVKASGNNEVCDRCGSRFQVFPGRRVDDGALTTRGSCTHHPGKIYYGERALGFHSQRPERKYRCCHQNLDNAESTGCTTSSSHVFKITDPKRLASVLNFVNTPVNPDVPVERAVGFDCEMGYTVYGLELIRLTVVSWPAGEELLDILVQPLGEVLDLNTRYSGVRPEDMVNAERWKPGQDHKPTVIANTENPSDPQIRRLKIAPSPKEARDLFFSLISSTTPVVGHGLENDLNAIRVVHPICIDTILLYPHKKGLPMRNGLKRLTKELLGRAIQTAADDAEAGKIDSQRMSEGHDSAEDARAAGELARLKVKTEWQERRKAGCYFNPDGSIVTPDKTNSGNKEDGTTGNKEDDGGGWTVMTGRSRKAK